VCHMHDCVKVVCLEPLCTMHRCMLVCAGPRAAAARARHQLCGAPPGEPQLPAPTQRSSVWCRQCGCRHCGCFAHIFDKTHTAHCAIVEATNPVTALPLLLFARRCCQICGLWRRRQLQRCPGQVHESAELPMTTHEGKSKHAIVFEQSLWCCPELESLTAACQVQASRRRRPLPATAARAAQLSAEGRPPDSSSISCVWPGAPQAGGAASTPACHVL
jgi:hypothetical protein